MGEKEGEGEVQLTLSLLLPLQMCRLPLRGSWQSRKALTERVNTCKPSQSRYARQLSQRESQLWLTLLLLLPLQMRWLPPRGSWQSRKALTERVEPL